jgi:tetratricopeptide (TPR) repeat protein
MLSNHPTVEDLEAFLRGTSRPDSRRRNAEILRHLLAECATCHEQLSSMGWSAQRLARLFQPTPNEAPAALNGYDYRTSFAGAERTLSALLSHEPQKTDSPDRLLAELEALPAEEQLRRVTNEDRFAHPGLVRLLLDRSHALRYRSAEEMVHLSTLARLAAEACSADKAGHELRRADLLARTWGQYGNALRVSGRPREAEEAFATAQCQRELGTGDPMLRGWLMEKITPLAIFQGRFDDAIEMCIEAGAIYQDLGESHLLASTLVQKAIAFLYSGKAEAAVRTLNQAIPLINHEEDPHLLLAACHNLIRCYIDLDRPEQALLLYFDVRELYQESSDPLILLRAAWQEGQLLRDLGHLRAAESALLRARKGYQERKLSYEVALVSLDLASVYVKLGLVEELKRTVLTTLPIFHALRVGLETLAALLQLQQVADQEQQALELIRTLNARIEPLRRQKIEER